jgi:hypothetical protein
MNALQVETDAQNTHMLLGGLLLTVQDAVAFEESEQSGSDLLQPSPADGNLLSSGMRTNRTVGKTPLNLFLSKFNQLLMAFHFRLFEPTNLFLCQFILFFLYVFVQNYLFYVFICRPVCLIIKTANKKIYAACSEKSAYSIASAASNSSLSGHSATHGNEPVSLTISDDFPAQILHDLEMTTSYGK